MRRWIWFFLAILAGGADAADDAIGESVGKYFAPSLVVELGSPERYGTRMLFAGTSIAKSSGGFSVALGAAYETHHSGMTGGSYGMLDPNSPAVQVVQQAAREKLTSVGGESGLRLGATIKKRWAARASYYTSRRLDEWFQFARDTDPYGRRRFQLNYRHLF